MTASLEDIMRISTYARQGRECKAYGLCSSIPHGAPDFANRFTYTCKQYSNCGHNEFVRHFSNLFVRSSCVQVNLKLMLIGVDSQNKSVVLAQWLSSDEQTTSLAYTLKHFAAICGHPDAVAHERIDTVLFSVHAFTTNDWFSSTIAEGVRYELLKIDRLVVCFVKATGAR